MSKTVPKLIEQMKSGNYPSASERLRKVREEWLQRKADARKKLEKKEVE